MASSPPPSPAKISSNIIAGKEQDVTTFVSDMLNQMETEFDQAGTSIMNRMRRMGEKMDDLERSITDLMHDAGIESVHDGQDENSLSKASSANTEGATPSKTGTNHDAKNAVL